MVKTISMCVFKNIGYRLNGVVLGAGVVLGLFFCSPVFAQDDLPPPIGGATEFDESAFGFEEETASSGESYEDATRKQAFEAAMDGLLPLRPEEIRALLERFDRTQESVELPVYPAPKPETVIENVDLDPGAEPLVIKMAYGHVTTVSFVDASGKPWPIHTMSWAGNFQIVETKVSEGEDAKNEYSSKIIMSPSSEFAYGNISINLLGLETPIIMTLETSRDIVYYRFDAVVPEYGPLAKAPIIQSSAGAGLNAVAGGSGMSSALEGIVPSGAIRLNVSGVDARTSAFSYNGMTYVRTPLSLLSPAWSSSVSSQDGYRVYELNRAPVLLLSDRGRMVRARVSNREDIFDE